MVCVCRHRPDEKEGDLNSELENKYYRSRKRKAVKKGQKATRQYINDTTNISRLFIKKITSIIIIIKTVKKDSTMSKNWRDSAFLAPNNKGGVLNITHICFVESNRLVYEHQ